MIRSKASASWTGGFKTGRGFMKPAHGADVPFTAGSRFEGQPASNPEELVGAALAGCFSMALTVGLEQAGYAPAAVQTQAVVHLEKGDGGFSIPSIELVTQATVPGADPAKFQEIAQATKQGCPVSKALGGVRITLQATLAD